MSIRRMMLFTLGGWIKAIILAFKTRVIADSGTFEAETNLESQLDKIGKDLFDSASLVITPNGVKTSKLYSIKPNDGTGDLSVTRATTATRVDENGNIVDVPANVARIDYSTGQPAILVEPQRTNLVFPSNIATTQVRAVTARAYTLSFYGTGSVVLSGAYTGNLNGTGANNRVSLTFTPTAGNLTLTVSGSVTNWQLEAGSNATSVIKTISGSVTRNADVISKSDVSSLIGQTEGVLFVDFNFTKSIDVYRRLITISDGTLNNRIVLALQASGLLDFLIVKNSVNQAISLANNVLILNSRNKIAIGYSENNTVLYVNGNLVYTSLSCSIPSCSNVYIGKRETSQSIDFFNDSIKSAILFPTRLSNAQLQQLTTL